jgi:3-methyladenine DNA glycosylase AlkD
MDIVYHLKSEFEKNRNPENAIHMKAYMKGHFDFYGVKSPERKVIVSTVWRKNKITHLADLNRFIKICWEQNEREWQYACMDITGKCTKYFDKNTIHIAEWMITTKSWWDTVDWISAHVVGKCFIDYPKLKLPMIEKWMKTDNIWLQRACLIYQLKYGEKTDFDLMKNLIIELKTSKEFFIQKAAGWALRQYSKFRPDLVAEFIALHTDLSSITKREGLKYC